MIGCLENIDLENADLRPQNSKNTDLENADLESTDLENADLENADLENADLENADLENTDLANKDLENTDVWMSHHVTPRILSLWAACGVLCIILSFVLAFFTVIWLGRLSLASSNQRLLECVVRLH